MTFSPIIFDAIRHVSLAAGLYMLSVISLRSLWFFEAREPGIVGIIPLLWCTQFHRYYSLHDWNHLFLLINANSLILTARSASSIVNGELSKIFDECHICEGNVARNGRFSVRYCSRGTVLSPSSTSNRFDCNALFGKPFPFGNLHYLVYFRTLFDKSPVNLPECRWK